MSAVAGLLTVLAGQSAPNNTDEWVSEFQDTILVRNSRGLNAGTTLFGLMSRLKNEPAESTEFKWFERDPVQREIKVNATGGYNNVATTVVVDDGTGADGTLDNSKSVDGLCQPGTILLCPSGELIRVTAAATGVSTSTSLTVTRGFASTTAASIAQDAKLVIVTLGKDEGASPTGATFQPPTTLTNYIQTFNSTVNLSNAYKGTKLRTDIEGPLRERRVQALERIARDIELAYLLGKKSNSAGSTGIAYYTGGLKASVDQIGASPTQALTAGGAYSIATQVNPWLASFMTLGSDAKLALCGPTAYSAFSTFANSATNGYRITGQESVYGMNITAVNTPFGELDLAMHPLMKEISSLSGWMFVVDLGLVVQKVMEPLFLEPNIQTPGSDQYLEQFRAKYGLKLKFANAFGYMSGLTSLAA